MLVKSTAIRLCGRNQRTPVLMPCLKYSRNYTAIASELVLPSKGTTLSHERSFFSVTPGYDMLWSQKTPQKRNGRKSLAATVRTALSQCPVVYTYKIY